MPEYDIQDLLHKRRWILPGIYIPYKLKKIKSTARITKEDPVSGLRVFLSFIFFWYNSSSVFVIISFRFPAHRWKTGKGV